MNVIKTEGARLGAFLSDLRDTPGLDQRWLSIGQTHLQEGLMALTRAVAQPAGF